MIRSFVCLLCIVFLACSSSKYQGFPSHEYELVSTANSKVKSLIENNYKINSCKLLMTVKFRDENRLIKLRQALIYTEPNRFRFEIYPDNAAYALSSFVTDGKDYSYYDNQEKQRVEGQYSQEVIQEYLQLPFSPEELLGILFANVPQEWLTGSSVLIPKDLEELSYGTVNREVFFSLNQQKRLKKFKKFQIYQDRLILSGEILSYQDFEGLIVPGSLKITLAKYDLDISFKVRVLGVNQDIPKEVFHVRD